MYPQRLDKISFHRNHLGTNMPQFSSPVTARHTTSITKAYPNCSKRSLPSNLTVTATDDSGTGSSARPFRLQREWVLIPSSSTSRTGVQTIASSRHTDITDSVSIDGTTQGGFAVTPLIVLNSAGGQHRERAHHYHRR